MRRLWPVLRVLVGLGILVALGLKLGASAFWDGVRRIDATALLAALAIGGYTTVCSAWRWRVVARRLGLRLELPTAIADYYRALLLNAVLPAGVLGDAHRAVSHGRRNGDVGRGVRAVVLERAAGQAVLLVLGLAVLLAQPTLRQIVAGALVPSPKVALALLAGLIGITALVIVAVRRANRGRRSFGVSTVLADLRVGLLTPAVVPLSVAALLGHLGLFLIAARIAGTTAPATALLPLLLLALVAMSLPVNVGGWGPREAALALTFGASGLSAAQGLSTSVVYGVLALVASLPGIAVLPLRRRPSWLSRRMGHSLGDRREVPAERVDQAVQQRAPLSGGGK